MIPHYLPVIFYKEVYLVSIKNLVFALNSAKFKMMKKNSIGNIILTSISKRVKSIL